MSGAVDALAPSATKVRIWPTRWISLPPSSDPTTIPAQKPAPTAPTAVGENPSSVPRTLSSVACNALPVSMRPKPKSRANRPAIVAYSVAGIDALHGPRVNPSQELTSEDREKHTRETSTLEGSARTKPPFQAIVRVRSGSQADILGGLRDVRYSPASSTGRRNTPSEWEKVERGR